MSAASRPTLVTFFLCAAALAAACRGCGAARNTTTDADLARQTASNLLLVTIDTLRADAVGVYGSASARTPTLDALAADGARFDSAFAPTPITLPSHASLLTGFPPGHGARHNGIAARGDVPTLAIACEKAGFATAASSRRFRSIADLAWREGSLSTGTGFRAALTRVRSTSGPARRRWMRRSSGWRPGPEGWCHALLFVGPSLRAARAVRKSARRPAREGSIRGRGRGGGSAGGAAARGAGIGAIRDARHRRRRSWRSVRRARRDRPQHLRVRHDAAHPAPDGRTWRQARSVRGTSLSRRRRADRARAAWTARVRHRRRGCVQRKPERRQNALRGSFAPLLDFGWSALRSVRRDGWKYIAAPRPELFNVAQDPGEATDRAREEPARAADLDGSVSRISGPDLPRDASAAMDPEAEQRCARLDIPEGRRGRS